MPSTLLRPAELRRFRAWIRSAHKAYRAVTLTDLVVRTNVGLGPSAKDVRLIERTMYEKGSFAPKTADKIANMVLNCPKAIEYRRRIGNRGTDSIDLQWQSVLRPQIAPTPGDLVDKAPAIIPTESQGPLALLMCLALKRKNLLKGSIARAVAEVERVMRQEAPSMARGAACALFERLAEIPECGPLEFARACEQLAGNPTAADQSQVITSRVRATIPSMSKNVRCTCGHVADAHGEDGCNPLGGELCNCTEFEPAK
jgi:hypothetical protein